MNTPQDPIQRLQERGYIHQNTDLEGFREHLQLGCATVYLGKKRHCRIQLEV
jgi:hypothetical protein